MKRQEGMIFNIQRFSVHDGPGIRTTFFLKGCPLRCQWCHNPEGLTPLPQIGFHEDKCIACGECITNCQQGCHGLKTGDVIPTFDQCTMCMSCVQNCPANALKRIGTSITTEEVLSIAKRDKVFYGMDGGVTFSGGEALLQSQFLVEVLDLCKEEGLSTVIDTSGSVPWQFVEQTIPFTDLYLYDIKAITDQIHREGTGLTNDQILCNFKELNRRNHAMWVRIPVIPGFNTTEAEMTKIAEFIKKHKGTGLEQVQLIPYHKLGCHKYEIIGMEYKGCDLPIMDIDTLKTYEDLFRSRGLNIVTNIKEQEDTSCQG